MSASESDAVITTAASVGWGRSRNRPGTNRSMAAIRIAPNSPVTCVLAPACSATAVRDPLVLTGKPWKSPAPRLATPIPIISLLPSTSSPDRPANADDVAMVSASETSAIPNAPATSGRRSERCTSGMVSGGNPSGSVPTSFTPCCSSPNPAATAIDTITATSTFGHTRQRSARTSDHRQAEHADGERCAHRFTVADAVDECPCLVHEAIRIGREAEQLGS